MGAFKQEIFKYANWGYGDGYHDYSGGITLGSTTATNTGTLVLSALSGLPERESNLAWLDRRVREMRVAP